MTKGKNKLCNKIRYSFFDEEANFAWWVDRIGYAYESGYSDDEDELIFDAYPAIEYGDESIANCYLAMEQLLLLLAEKEDIIPRFSDGIKDSEKVISCKDGHMHENYKVHKAAFKAAMQQYGFEMNRQYNYLSDDDKPTAHLLDPDFIKEIIGRDRSEKSLEQFWGKFVNGEITPEDMQKELMEDSFYTAVYSITSPKGLEAERRYYQLPSRFKKVLKKDFDFLKLSLRHISSPMGSYECLAADTDSLDKETGETIPFWYAPSYCEDYNGYGCGNTIGAAEMAGPECIFRMEDTYKKIIAFEKKLTAAENKARKFLHERAVKAAKARWKKYKLMFA